MPECFAHFQGEIPRQLFPHHFQPAIVRHLKYICNGVLRSSGVLKTQLVKVTWVQPTISLRLLGKINDAPAVVNVATGGYFFSFFFSFRGLLKWGCEQRDVGVLGIWTALLGNSVADAPVQVQIAVALHRDTESRAHFDTARGDREQRNVLSSTFRLSLLLTAPYSFHPLH